MKTDAHDRTSGRLDDLDWARHAGVAEEIIAGLEQRARARRVRRAAVGGALVLALSFGAVWLSRPDVASRAGEHADVAETLAVRQSRSELLPDGSIVELRDGAEIAVDYSAGYRRVELVRGAAHFAVAKNPDRPFIVSARGVEVRAVGTAFAVDSDTHTVEVIVTEGKVAVEAVSVSATQPDAGRRVLAAISAGHRTVVRLGSGEAEIERLDGQELISSLSWRIPRVEFSKSTIAQVVTELNKHNRTQLVLGDAEVGRYQISGTLRADRVDALVEMLAADFGIHADRSTDRIVIRSGH